MGTKFVGTRAQVRALNSYISLVRAADAVVSRIHQHLTTLRLSPPQFAILEALYHLGPLSQRELSKKIVPGAGNISTVVDTLEKRMLLKREKGEKDRRLISVYLTEEGKELISSIFPSHVDAVVAEFKQLTATEQEELRRLCVKLGMRE